MMIIIQNLDGTNFSRRTSYMGWSSAAGNRSTSFLGYLTGASERFRLHTELLWISCLLAGIVVLTLDYKLVTFIAFTNYAIHMYHPYVSYELSSICQQIQRSSPYIGCRLRKPCWPAPKCTSYLHVLISCSRNNSCQNPSPPKLSLQTDPLHWVSQGLK